MSQQDPTHLIDAYLDGLISPEDQQKLHDWLCASRENVDFFVDRCNLNSDIRQILLVQDIGRARSDVLGEEYAKLTPLPENTDANDRSLGDTVSGLIPLKDVEKTSTPSRTPPAPTEHTPTVANDKEHKLVFHAPGVRVYRTRFNDADSRRFTARTFLAAAAMLIAATAAIYFAFFNQPPTNPMLATLTGVNNVTWASENTDLPLGAELKSGRYDLQAGFAELTMSRGATVLIEGPCIFELLNDNAIRMHRGRIAAQVPERAIQFTVKTPTAQIVDLGTEFGVDVKASGHTVAAVFDGRVRLAEAIESSDQTPQTVELTQGKQTHVDTTGRLAPTIAPIATNHTFIRTLRESTETPTIEGPVEFHRLPLHDLRRNVIEDSMVAILYKEATGIALPQQLGEAIVGPGEYKASEIIGADGVVDAGTRVDSYIIHFDAERWQGELSRVDATVTFTRPIVAVIAQAPHLAATDAYFANDNTVYPQGDEENKGRGLADTGATGFDSVTLHPDGKTLSFRFHDSNQDQIRVLIASD